MDCSVVSFLQKDSFKSNSLPLRRCISKAEHPIVFEKIFPKKMQQPVNDIWERISFRTAVMPDDGPFLEKLYASTRDDLAGFITDGKQLRQLLKIQHNAQKAAYSAEYRNATHDILLLDGESIGRLIVDRRPDALHGVDLALLPQVRNMGIGTAVLRNLFEECKQANLPLIFHVLKTNPARKLYERLGCYVIRDDGTHFSMEWRTQTQSNL